MSYLHRAWAEINLDALLNNFDIIKSTTDSKIFSVVKANAYGHSVGPIARLLDEAGTYAFAVSNIDEAKELRNLGIKKPVLILGYTPIDNANSLAQYDITQSVFSLEYAEKLDSFAKKHGIYIKAHLKLDTGMGRIGFNCRTEELSDLNNIKAALKLENITYEGVFMHFCVADSYENFNVAYTEEQYKRFLSAVDALEKEGYSFKLKHCCNSAGTLLCKEKHLDAVRPGIILYGLTPSTEIQIDHKFKPVMSFKTAVSMVKTVEQGSTLSYGRTYTLQKSRKIATLSVGYADGYPRLLSNKGYVLINGQKANIVGRICMDQMCVDVTDIDNIKEGDTVTLFGDGLPVELVADWASTINYEIVCGLSKRVPRVYIRDKKEIEI